MSLYNKYRPDSFDDLIQTKFNNNLTKHNLTHHSYLLFGPPGTGKTTTARLCMAEFCDTPEDKALCISGKHIDYVEVNCAVNTGIDDVRNIISDVVGTMPSNAPYKFIIFDESHMLSTNSQNALLKTVEEPPRHVKFFFCTTELNKVIPAIRSRCQIVPFFKIQEKSLIKIAKRICDGENLSYNEESLSIIVASADGSARTAINLIEQCASCLEDPDAISQIIGTSSVKNFYNLTKFICDKNKIESINLLDELFNNAVDPGSLMNKYADYLSDLITKRIIEPTSCEFEGKKLLFIADCVTTILKDFKILQNIKLISKINVLKTIEKM